MRQGIEDDFNDWLLEARTKEKEVARHKLEEAKRIMETARETSARHTPRQDSNAAFMACRIATSQG